MSLKSGISPEEEIALREYLVTAAKELEEDP
jgi:hypothetical protein